MALRKSIRFVALSSFASLAAIAGACVGSSNTPLTLDAGGFDGAFPSFDGAIPLDGALPGFDATTRDGATPPDSAAPPDGATDAGPLTDAADAAPSALYNDMTNPSFWSLFDTTSLDGGNARGFEGATFDGRYIYFAPFAGGSSGVVTRYDTQASFDSGSAWQTFDLTTVSSAATGFAGAVFDGRYVYLVPRYSSVAASAGNLVPRFDTQGSFTDSAAWSIFSTTTVNAAANGFVGAVFDGHYLYFVPYKDTPGASHGVVARYDTKGAAGDFNDAGAWSTFDTTTLDPNAKGFYGGVFDGRYLYLVPWISGKLDGGATAYGSVVARLDTRASATDFTDAGAWSTFDTTAANPSAKGFGGGAFDGQYVYLVPSLNGTVTRFDARGSGDFKDAGSWSTFDVSGGDASATGFTGATFDGRYVYLAPYYGTSYDGLVVRYDTQAGFTAGGSWSHFDTATLPGSAGKAVGFIGTLFDGRYVYMVPCCNGGSSYTGMIPRFDSKAPPSMPPIYGPGGPVYTGSFL